MRLEAETVKMPVVPEVVKQVSLRVGSDEVLTQTPLCVIEAPPSLVTLPPKVEPVEVTEVTVGVVTVALLRVVKVSSVV